MEARLAELEASLRRWRVISAAALVIAAFSVVWTAVRVLTEPPAPIHADASNQFEQPGLRRPAPGARRPGLNPNGPRKRRPNRQGANKPNAPDPAEEPATRESPPP